MQPRLPKPAACDTCILARKGFGYAPDDGPRTARLNFLAEALGGDEAILGRPLVGAAGGVHSRLLVRAGITREHTRADNTIRCQPPGNWFDEQAPWYYPAMTHCAGYRAESLAAIPDNGALVTYGATALKTALGLHGVDGVNVRDFHGTVNRDPSNRYWVIPTFHPSHLQRGAMNLLEVVTSDLRLAEKVSREGFVKSPTVLSVDPLLHWFQQWVTQFIADLARDPESTWLALDTEFPEKAKGQDESEIDVRESSGSPIIRYNVARNTHEGITVPADPAFKAEIERLLQAIAAHDGYVWYWNKYADVDHLRSAGHTVAGINHIDLMWLCHYLQSDIPRGLGFWAPFASDFGPWKHWAHDPAKFGAYAAADAVQTYRIAVWAVKAAIANGSWDVFLRDWHERDLYVLRPSYQMGVPMDRPALEAFHADLQAKHTKVLAGIHKIGAEGTLRPKAGYAKRPTHNKAKCYASIGIDLKACTAAKHDLYWEDRAITGGPGAQFGCRTCQVGAGFDGDVQPPKSLLGAKHGQRKSEAKAAYTTEHVTLVERSVSCDVRICTVCHKVGVPAAHRCWAKPPRKARRRAGSNGADSGVLAHGGGDQPALPASVPDTHDAQAARYLVTQSVTQPRWYWCLPFNPSSWQQILSYIEGKGHVPGTHRKTKKPTTDATTLKRLAAETGDPLYQLLLDGRAIEKVDGTYALGSLKRLDADDRLHPEIVPVPSTLRDSSRDPNLQNVVADKDKGKNLAAGFRGCVVARDGVPAGADVDAWARRWGVARA